MFLQPDLLSNSFTLPLPHSLLSALDLQAAVYKPKVQILFPIKHCPED